MSDTIKINEFADKLSLALTDIIPVVEDDTNINYKTTLDKIQTFLNSIGVSGYKGIVTPNVNGIPQLDMLGGDITENGFYIVSENGNYGNFTNLNISNNFIILGVEDISTTPLYSKAEIPITIAKDATPTAGSSNVVESGGVESYTQKTFENKNLQINTITAPTWDGETGVFTWGSNIDIIPRQQLIFRIAPSNKTIPQNSLLIASSTDGSFTPLDVDADDGIYTAYAYVANAFFDFNQKGCFILGKNTSTKWSSKFPQLNPVHWQTKYTDTEAQVVAETVVGSSLSDIEIVSKNGILSKDADAFFTGFTLTTVDLPTNDYFSNLGINRGILKPSGTGTSTEAYISSKVVDGLILPKNNQWLRWSYFIYSPNVDVVATSGRLRTLWLGGTQFNSASGTLKKIDDNIWLVSGKGQFTGDLTSKNEFWFENVLEVDGGGNFANENIYFTGFTLGYSDNENFSLRDGILHDYKNITKAKLSTLEESVNKWNNLNFNTQRVAEWMRKYEMKEVDAFNQLSLVCVGDSIFARQTLTEMSLTQDTNGGSGDGYVTGHFPPNMWNETIPFKLLEAIQYQDADVKYFNHVASEVTKTGTWTTDVVEPDKVRIAFNNGLGDDISLNFTNSKYVKCIFSSYYASGISSLMPFQIRISVNSGSYVTPESLGLTTSLEKEAGVDGDYKTGNQLHKWFNIIIGGLDESNTYDIKFINQFGANLAFWGFETWSKPRINVIVTAEGGNTASNQLTRWERFYSEYYENALVIYELPYLNDLGTGIITNYKGVATTSTTPSGSPAINDFWYASQTGTYTNFSGVSALQGQYLQYNGASWELGQTTLNTILSNYNTNNDSVFQRLATLGLPVITLVTHNSSSFYPYRHFTYKNGLTILRSLTAKYGFGSIDVNQFQMTNGFETSILSDGVHLNDTGVSMYVDLLKTLFDVDYANRFVGTGSKFINEKLTGSSTDGSTIVFGYEFSEIPKVRIYGNSSIAITEITKSSFTTTGTGDYDYEIYINN